MSIKVGSFIVKIVVLLSVMLTLIVTVPSVSHACSCIEPGSVQAELVRSKAVFAGKVLEVKEKKSLKGYMTKSVWMDVTEAWKGVSESQVIITTGLGGGDCGYSFQQGKEYLVYANLSSIYGGEDELVSIICSRTNELSAAQADLTILGPGDKQLGQVDLEREFNSINRYVWVIGVVVVGLVGLFVWRRIRLRSR